MFFYTSNHIIMHSNSCGCNIETESILTFKDPLPSLFSPKRVSDIHFCGSQDYVISAVKIERTASMIAGGVF